MALKRISTFASRLKEALGDMSITAFAQKVGLSKQAISAYITGYRVPKKPTIVAITAALGVNEAWLLGYDVERTHQTQYGVDLTDDELLLIQNYRKFNEQGQKRLNDYISDLLASGNYVGAKKETCRAS